MTFVSSRSRRSKASSRQEEFEIYEMRDMSHRRYESHLFDRDPRNTIKMNRSKREELKQPLTLTEELSIDVQVLNHCFSDIERFVGRLQHSAEYSREMDRRRSRYPNDRDAIYGNFAYRYRSPPVRDFTDIFQKMKLSINLLAKLKPYINAPNSPELVHFLFTPLSLVFDASRDPTIRHLNLSESAIVPMLTAAAKDLLLNCLTSKEIELWKLLGRNWTMTVDEWKGLLPFYTPKFYDGWEPSPSRPGSVLGSRRDLRTAVLAKAAESKHLFDKELALKQSDCPSEPSTIYCKINDCKGLVHSNSFKDPALPVPRLEKLNIDGENAHDNSFVDVHLFEVSNETTENAKNREPAVPPGSIFSGVQVYPSVEASQPSPTTVTSNIEVHSNLENSTGIMHIPVVIEEKPSLPTILDNTSASSDEDSARRGPFIVSSDSADFIQQLQNEGVKPCVVIHDREAGNTRELKLKKGDIVGLIDNTKNWWKVRNQEGVIGFAPYTILSTLKENDDRIAFKF